MTQAIISLPSGLSPICLQIQQDAKISQLKQRIFHLTSIPVDQQVLRTVGGNDLILPAEEDIHLSLSLRLLGGKGGFGSMLRAQGGRMNAQKTTNFEACRDLQGRRIRTVNEAKRLQEELDAIPEREQEKREKLKKKIDKALKEREPKKHLFDDSKFLEDKETMVDSVRSSVEHVIKRQKTSYTSSSTASISKSLFDDDLSSSEEEEEDKEEDKDTKAKEEDKDTKAKEEDKDTKDKEEENKEKEDKKDTNKGKKKASVGNKRKGKQRA
ncbi:telomere stability and silencing-domain-containing protein [Sporodiniella umbellata]|nr:telomere stability and silencing-domain-containing protein [Sporodiniella umbellata]